MVEPGAVPGVDEMTTRAGAGFALSGGLAIDARAALDLLAGAADEGFDPVLVTEVNARSGLALSAALAARRPGVRAGTGIVPLGSRSEAALAMAATTVAQLAGAPFLLGVGTSSSQIVDGWHGQPYDASVATTRGRLRRLRSILDGERHGSFALARPRSGQVRVLLAALGPGMVELAFEASAGAMVNRRRRCRRRATASCCSPTSGCSPPTTPSSGRGGNWWRTWWRPRTPGISPASASARWSGTSPDSTPKAGCARRRRRCRGSWSRRCTSAPTGSPGGWPPTGAPAHTPWWCR
jgi:hypothetical protein